MYSQLAIELKSQLGLSQIFVLKHLQFQIPCIDTIEDPVNINNSLDQSDNPNLITENKINENTEQIIENTEQITDNIEQIIENTEQITDNTEKIYEKNEQININLNQNDSTHSKTIKIEQFTENQTNNEQMKSNNQVNYNSSYHCFQQFCQILIKINSSLQTCMFLISLLLKIEQLKLGYNLAFKKGYKVLIPLIVLDVIYLVILFFGSMQALYYLIKTLINKCKQIFKNFQIRDYLKELTVTSTLEQMDECCICLETVGPTYVRLKCSHHFHSDCIHKWFREDDHASCPYCKRQQIMNILQPQEFDDTSHDHSQEINVEEEDIEKYESESINNNDGQDVNFMQGEQIKDQQLKNYNIQDYSDNQSQSQNSKMQSRNDQESN